MIGNRLRQRRLQLGLTQQQLADKIGAKKNTISNYECNISSPSEEIIIALMEVLDCDANYLYGEFISSDNELKPVLDKTEKKLVASYRGFNDEGKNKIIDIISDMEQLPRYTKQIVYRAASSEDNHPAEIVEITPEEKERLDNATRITPENGDF